MYRFEYAEIEIKYNTIFMIGLVHISKITIYAWSGKVILLKDYLLKTLEKLS